MERPSPAVRYSLPCAADLAAVMRRGVLISAVLVLACSCASQRYQARPFDTGAALRAYERRSLDDADMRRDLAAQPELDHRSLDANRWNAAALERAANYFNPTLGAARAELATTEAEGRAAGLRDNPALDLAVQHADHPFLDESPWTLSFAFDIPIELAAKRKDRLSIARRMVDGAHIRVAQVAWDVKQRVDRARLSWYFAQQRLDVIERQVAASGQVVQVLRKRVDAGESSGSELRTREAEWLGDQAADQAAKTAVAQSRHELAAAIGIPEAGLGNAQLDFSDLESPLGPLADLIALHRELVVNRLDMRAALVEYDIAELKLKLEIAKQYPDIHLGPGYSYDQGQHKLSFAIGGITLPIFHDSREAIAEAEARRAAASARVEMIQTDALTALDGAYGTLQGAAMRVPNAVNVEQIKRQQASGVQRAFEQGVADPLEQGQAQLEWLAALLETIDARAQLAGARLDLENAMQRPLVDNGVRP